MSVRVAATLLVAVALLVSAVAAFGERPSAGPAETRAASTAGFSQTAMLGISPGSSIFDADNDQLAADLDAMVDLGVGWIRLDIDWSRIEQERGRHAWSETDEVFLAAHERGLRILGLLTYTPSWARPEDTTSKHPPMDPSDFGQFSSLAAERYAELVDGWEIWNEPNSALFWEPGPDPESYAEIFSAAAPGIRSADPTAVILSGGLAPARDIDGEEMSPEAFLDRALVVIDDSLIDAVAIHPYSFPADPSDTSKDWNLFGRLPAIRLRVAMVAGRPLSIWITEFGAPHDEDRPGRQAEIIAEGLNCAAHWTWTGPTFIYALNDAATDPGGLEFGLIAPSGAIRPAWSAVRAFGSVPGVPTPSACSSIEE